VKIVIKYNIGKKAVATWIIQVATTLFAIGVIAFLYFFLFGRYFDIHAIVVSNEAKRHVINMAQALLSSDKLVYEEDFGGGMKRFHRGVFDKNKLDEQLMTHSLDIKDSEVREEISYPNTGTQIVVSDLESDTSWTLAFGGPGLENQVEFMDCLYQNIEPNIFVWVFNFPINSPWNFWDFVECAGTYETKIGIFEKDFPVLINDNGDLHAGRLFIRVMEM